LSERKPIFLHPRSLSIWAARKASVINKFGKTIHIYMKKMNSRKPLALTILLAAVVSSAFTTHAAVAPIQLFNTGVNGTGSLLPNTTLDPHYSVVSAPGAYTTAYTGTGTDVPAMPWMAEGPNSRWIGVTPWMAEWRPAGTYDFRTTFDLSGLVPSTASISLKIAADDYCSVLLNGAPTGITTANAGFYSLASYNLSTGFVSGVNTLDFQVNEIGSTPSGLRVELSGLATVVPEPTTAALALLGGLLLVALRRTQPAH
jgi:hypothetical protein